MKQPMFKKDSEIDEKRIDRIETILSRLVRRARSKTSAMITPYPISSCLEGSGEVLRYMFCAPGTIQKGLIYSSRKLKGGVHVEVIVENSLNKNMKSYIIDKQSMIVKPNLPVESGDRLKIFVDVVDETEHLDNTWVSFLWIPTMKSVDIKSFLIDELEKDIVSEE